MNGYLNQPNNQMNNNNNQQQQYGQQPQTQMNNNNNNQQQQYGQQPQNQMPYGNQNQNQQQQPISPSNSYSNYQPSNPSPSPSPSGYPDQSCPCQNGGLCVQLPSGGVGCSCRYGFTGDRCEKSKR